MCDNGRVLVLRQLFATLAFATILGMSLPLDEMTQNGHSKVIAVDMDDVLCNTNHMAAQWHNRVYPDTHMDVQHFYCTSFD